MKRRVIGGHVIYLKTLSLFLALPVGWDFFIIFFYQKKKE